MLVERGKFKVVPFDGKGGDDVVTNHGQPLHLLFGQRFVGAGVVFKSPCLEVFTHGFAKRGDFAINANHSANKAD